MTERDKRRKREERETDENEDKGKDTTQEEDIPLSLTRASS